MPSSYRESSAEFEKSVADDAVLRELYLDELYRDIEHHGVDGSAWEAHIRGGFGGTPAPDADTVESFPTGQTLIPGQQRGTDGGYTPA